MDLPVIEIPPKAVSQRVEYLVVMRVSDGPCPELRDLKLSETDDVVSVQFELAESPVVCSFNRSGALGGRISMRAGNVQMDRALADRIVG